MVGPEPRLFIAIELPASLREQIAEVIDTMRARGLGNLRWVRPDAMHLTIKFLGETPEAQVPGIVGVMRKAASGVRPFTLSVAGAGAFPNLRAPRILWLGVDGDTASLRTLHEALEGSLEGAGFPRETRTFTPHLTLARISDRLEPRRRAVLSEQSQNVEPARFSGIRVDALSLMESRLARGGAVYTQRCLVPLDASLA